MKLDSKAFGLAPGSARSSEVQNELPARYNLGIGEPLLSKLPSDIYEKAPFKEGINLYYPASGDLNLRSLIIDRYYPGHTTDQIAITNGAIGGIDFILRHHSEFCSEILFPNPGFPPYRKLAEFSKYNSKFYNIILDDIDETINWDSIFEQTTENTKLLLLNSPHNPSGKVLSQYDKEKLLELLERYPDLYFIMDEVYRELIFGGEKHLDLTKYLDRGYIVGSFSKVFPIQGARIGWVLTSVENQKSIESLFQNVYGSVSSYGQELAKEILIRKLNYFELYAKVQAQLINELDRLNLDYITPKGSFFCFIKLDRLCDLEVAKELKSLGVIVLPGSAFGSKGKGYIRISFAQDIEILKDGLRIIADLNSHK